MGWVHASERLSLLHLGKASRGNAKVKTGIGKSDLPGLQGGPRKRDLVIYDKVRASRLYPDHVRICERLGVKFPGPTRCLRQRSMYLVTLLSPMSMPSLSSSP
jgi:hypothetical protein